MRHGRSRRWLWLLRWFGARGEGFVDLPLTAAEPGEFLGTVPWESDPRGGAFGFGAGRRGLLVQLGHGVGEPVEVTFQAGDEVGRVAAAEVIGKERDLNVDIGSS